MALKVISGFIRPTAAARSNGAARLNLTSGQFSSGDPITVFDRRVIGSGAYLGKPCVTLALRRIRLYVGDLSEPNEVELNLDDDFLPSGAATPTSLVIAWTARQGLGGQHPPTGRFIRGDEIREISFLVIGETA